MFWSNRWIEVRRTSWVFIANHILAQFSAICSPLNPTHFTVNCVYTAFTILQTTMLVFSYKSPKMLYLIQPVAVMLTLRATVRLFDIEKTKFMFDDPDNKSRLDNTGWLLVMAT